MANTVTLRDVAADDRSIFFDQQLDVDANYMAAFTSKDPIDYAAFDTHWATILADSAITIKTILAGEQVAGYVVHGRGESGWITLFWPVCACQSSE